MQYAKKTSAKGFVNAILRRATRETIDFAFADDVDRISVTTSHPRWLVEKWAGQFGVEEAENIAAANNEIPRIAFRISACPGGPLQLNTLPSEFVEGCFISETIDEELLELSDRGEIYFQEEASQMVAASVRIQNGEHFLDVCAAPGSKATQISSKYLLLGSNSRLIIAGDLHYRRVHFMRGNFAAQCIEQANLLQYDAVDSLPFADESFDVVLVDAPCSGTGTIRHNPEIRYFLSSDDFHDLSREQLAILQNASKLVKRGGRLFYSTCSMETEENEAVVAEFLTDNTDFKKTKPNIPDRFVSDELYAHTFPHIDNMDGFFIAAFERI
ncbi:MAG: methyltransferase domain-containing protein [Saprospiraceae bacterium]|nr:methyltransferase domain-containing protein [Pyrinomonadaceae bacterium]